MAVVDATDSSGSFGGESSEDDSSFNSLFANSESEYPIVARDGSIDVAVPEPMSSEPNGQIEPAFEPSL